jgi:hypothetical protein
VRFVASILAPTYTDPIVHPMLTAAHMFLLLLLRSQLTASLTVALAASLNFALAASLTVAQTVSPTVESEHLFLCFSDCNVPFTLHDMQHLQKRAAARSIFDQVLYFM